MSNWKKMFLLLLGMLFLSAVATAQRPMNGMMTVGFSVGQFSKTDAEVKENVSNPFFMGLQLGYMLTNHIELNMALEFELDMEISLFGDEEYSAGHFLIGSYYHFAKNIKSLDLQLGLGVDLAQVTYAPMLKDKKKVGFWVACGIEIPIKFLSGTFRPGLGVRYLFLDYGTAGQEFNNTALDFSGFNWSLYFKLAFPGLKFHI